MTTAERVSLRQMAGIAPAREGEAGDAVDGLVPSFVVQPETIGQAAELMRLAGRGGLAMIPRGAGTKLGWGGVPERLDLIVDMSRMDRVLEHASGDLIAVIQPGALLTSVHEVVGQAGQRLMIDPYARGTIGGTVAAGASGPHRHRYGTMRDLLIGITVVLADGTVAKAGGKVVKNVAGYDLGKLFHGSMGTLGLIVETVVRLHALPEARRLVEVDVSTPALAGKLVLALKDSPLVPSAVEMTWQGGGGTLSVLFEGVEPGVVDGAERAALLGASLGDARIVEGDELDRRWEALTEPPWEEGEVGVKVSLLPTALPALLDTLEALETAGVGARARGQAAMSVLYVALSGVAGAMPQAIETLRAAARRSGGSLMVLQAGVQLKRSIDVWGPVGDALPLMKRLKDQFDPGGTMSPGRFVGGI